MSIHHRLAIVLVLIFLGAWSEVDGAPWSSDRLLESTRRTANQNQQQLQRMGTCHCTTPCESLETAADGEDSSLGFRATLKCDNRLKMKDGKLVLILKAVAENSALYHVARVGIQDLLQVGCFRDVTELDIRADSQLKEEETAGSTCGAPGVRRRDSAAPTPEIAAEERSVPDAEQEIERWVETRPLKTISVPVHPPIYRTAGAVPARFGGESLYSGAGASAFVWAGTSLSLVVETVGIWVPEDGSADHRKFAFDSSMPAELNPGVEVRIEISGLRKGEA